MRFARVTLLLLLLVGASSFVTYRLVRSHPEDKAATFFTTADDHGHCTSWGHGRGADSTTYSSWCESDRVFFYCTAGAARWEKDKDGSWVNLNDPKCMPKLDLNKKAATATTTPAAPPQPTQAPPPLVTPTPTPPPAPPPAAITPPTPTPPPSSPATGSAATG